jgi:hypothetical protein
MLYNPLSEFATMLAFSNTNSNRNSIRFLGLAKHAYRVCFPGTTFAITVGRVKDR